MRMKWSAREPRGGEGGPEVTFMARSRAAGAPRPARDPSPRTSPSPRWTTRQGTAADGSRRHPAQPQVVEVVASSAASSSNFCASAICPRTTAALGLPAVHGKGEPWVALAILEGLGLLEMSKGRRRLAGVVATPDLVRSDQTARRSSAASASTGAELAPR